MSELSDTEKPPVICCHSDNDDLKIDEEDSRECLATMGPVFSCQDFFANLIS